MRFGEKSIKTHDVSSKLLGVDFHDFIEKEAHSTSVELASEFGLSVGEARKLKKQIGRY